MPEPSDDTVAASLRGVSVSYGSQAVLRDLDLELGSGLVHGLLGRGGSGRTTLMKTIATIRRPDAGSVRILGVDTTACDEHQLAAVRSETGFQFQNLGLFDSMSAMDNVLFPLTRGAPETASPEQIDQARRALDEVGLSGSGEKAVSELSGGMQRRLAIARAIAPAHVRMICFDDPAGGLDPVTAAAMLRLIRTRSGEIPGRTVLIAGHDIAGLFATCDMIHVIHDGAIAFSGTPADAARSTCPAVTALIDAAASDGTSGVA